MRAITICQPFAELIRRGDKRVENRVWGTRYRGPLLIHAGKSRAWLDRYAGNDDFDAETLAWGAIVAVADLATTGRIDTFRDFSCGKRFAWVASHPHASGPYCWVLENVRSLPEPIPCNGRQGLWTPSPEILARLAAMEVASHA